MERVERDGEVELVPVGEPGRVAGREVEVLPLEVLPREGDHVRGGVDTQHRAPRQAIGDFRGDLAIAAAHVEDALTIGQRQAGEVLVGDPFLERRLTVVPPAFHSVMTLTVRRRGAGG